MTDRVTDRGYAGTPHMPYAGRLLGRQLSLHSGIQGLDWVGGCAHMRQRQR